jgi:hypothetical protein
MAELLVGTTNSAILDQQPSIKGILVGTTSSDILDQQSSIKGTLESDMPELVVPARIDFIEGC